jgi:hypothetical protein
MRPVQFVPRRAGNLGVKRVVGHIDGWRPDFGKYANSPQAYAETWKAWSSLLRQWFATTFIVSSSAAYRNAAVVHFRCSDVPFMRHKIYHLYPRKYFQFAGDKIKKLGIDEVAVLFCRDHGLEHLTEAYGYNATVARAQCSMYAAVISNWLVETGLKVGPSVCVDSKTTWAIMANSAALVSTGGSFSFLPGVSKTKGRFISPRYATEGATDINGKQLAKAVHWSMWDGESE